MFAEVSAEVSGVTIALISGGLGILGSLLGVLVGLFGARWVRRVGDVECKLDNWYVQRGATYAEERRLQVTFKNGKDLPVTVWEMRVEFYKEDLPLEDWTRPSVEFVDERDQKSPMGLLNLPPHTAVPRTLSVTPGRDDKVEALAGADRAVFVASIDIVGDKRLELSPPW